VVIVEKVINIDQNSRSQTAMESVWPVSILSTESIGSRRKLVANCVHTADATQLHSFVGVGGVYWALRTISILLSCYDFSEPCKDYFFLEMIQVSE